MDICLDTDCTVTNQSCNETMEEENQRRKRRRFNSDQQNEMKHHYRAENKHRHDREDIRLADANNTPKDLFEDTSLQTKSENNMKGKAGAKQQPLRISLARGSKKCPTDCKLSGSSSSIGNVIIGSSREKCSAVEESLSDRICHVVWSRKGNVQLTPSGSRRTTHHSSARRGTAPNVPLMRHCFESKPDAFGRRSQSFKGSSTSGLAKKRTFSYRDSLSRRASGDAVSASKLSPLTYRALLHSLKAKQQLCRHRVGDCTCKGEIGSANEIDFRPNQFCKVTFKQKHSEPCASVSFSSTGRSGQHLIAESPIVVALADPFEIRNQVGSLSSGYRDHRGNFEPSNDCLMTRQISMTLSIPSRENSLRSCTSSQSNGSHSGSMPATPTRTLMPIPCTSSSITKPIATTSKAVTIKGTAPLASRKLVKSGSNPDLRPSGQTKLKQHEQFYKLRPKFERQVSASRSPLGSVNDVNPISSRGRHSKDNSTFSLAEKKKQILSQKQERNEKVAWAVHLGFSSLLILAITCIVVFLRLSSSTVRNENEKLLQSIQPQLSLNNTSTHPPPTNTHQVNDNSIGSEEKGHTNGEKGLDTIHQSGNSLIGDLKLSAFSSERSSGTVIDGQPTSNNDTTHGNLNSILETVEDSTTDRSNNNNSSNSNNSSKTSRPKRYSILGNALKGKLHTDLANDSSSSQVLKKARHLERTFLRFIKNASSGSPRMRQRRQVDLESRKL